MRRILGCLSAITLVGAVLAPEAEDPTLIGWLPIELMEVAQDKDRHLAIG
ncbi:MAG: hypothetical protein M3Y59_05560 [Myxococcota bacterium]|nr:hypothetical protein [Myxococcota bacterium]